ncbi:MAG: threonine--tRNA ligase, partial [Anaerovoracaceae bacterium]|nr:threonine--tRNA ligase [Anaerovoracaceae bacterium]
MADIKWEDEAYRDAFRHTSSHILAQAVKKFWPEAKLAIGPAIENGFYYDFDLDHKFTEDDFAKIEEEMRNIIKEDLPLEHYTMPRDEALKFWKDRNEDYKVELIEDLPDEKELSFYRQGDYVDLCAGPHVESTGVIGAVKLTSVAGAYWRGDSDNKMLQRIYGTSFPTQEMLDEYLEMIEEAKKRDHRKIGKEM